MLVIFSIVLPLILIIGSMVVSIGSWYTHGRHLQTKVDAAAFAGGGSWAFPCASDIDAKIEDFARQYAGQHMKADGSPYSTTTFNPQVGDVQGDQIHVVLNGPDWYDADTNPNPTEPPAAGNLCNAKTLDVKGTEQDSPLLWGWLPFYPDIKKKARVEIQEVEGLNGLLPIAVRAPEPVSAAAVFYNESTGNILGTKYFVKNPAIPGIPANLQGWSTYNTEDAGTWASFVPSAATGVRHRRELPWRLRHEPPEPKHEDRKGRPHPVSRTPASRLSTSFATKARRHRSSIATRRPGPGRPKRCGRACISSVDIRPSGTVTQCQPGAVPPDITNGCDPPQLRSAHLANLNCPSNGYFNAHPNSTCNARLNVAVDLGDVMENPPPNPPNTPEQTRTASNVSVTYRLVRADGSTFCDYGANCELQANPNATGTVTYSTTGSGSSPDLPLTANSEGNSVAIQIRVKGSTVVPNPGNCGPGLGGFGNNCRWFHTGNGAVRYERRANERANSLGACSAFVPRRHHLRRLCRVGCD